MSPTKILLKMYWKRIFSRLLMLCIGVVASACAQADTLSINLTDDEPPFSANDQGKAKGILPDLLRILDSLSDEIEFSIQTFPWSRAQAMVEAGRSDALFTYPSEARKAYAHFTQNTAYEFDYGYLIFHKGNSHRDQLIKVKGFADLAGLTMIGQQDTDWEDENIPASISRVNAINLNTMMHLLFLRKAGDFIVMPAPQAIYLAQQFQYARFLEFVKVDFIPNAILPFHIGIRQTHPNAKQLIRTLDQLIQSESFRSARTKLLENAVKAGAE